VTPGSPGTWCSFPSKTWLRFLSWWAPDRETISETTLWLFGAVDVIVIVRLATSEHWILDFATFNFHEPSNGSAAISTALNESVATTA
jgi:hypothetical protein